MSDMSESIRAKTRRNHAVILRAISDVTGKRVAELIGVSESTLSAMKSDNLERFASLIAACGLKIVPITEQVYDESVISAIKTLAAIGLGRDLKRVEGDDE